MTEATQKPLPDRVANYIARSAGLVIPGTAEEYFTVILERASRAGQVGDYGIGAALVLRARGVEVVSLGWSTGPGRRHRAGSQWILSRDAPMCI